MNLIVFSTQIQLKTTKSMDSLIEILHLKAGNCQSKVSDLDNITSDLEKIMNETQKLNIPKQLSASKLAPLISSLIGAVEVAFFSKQHRHMPHFKTQCHMHSVYDPIDVSSIIDSRQ